MNQNLLKSQHPTSKVWLLLLVGLTIGIAGPGCLEPYCEKDTDCRSGERCSVATNQCVRQDAGQAWPLDGSVAMTDGSVVPDSSTTDGGDPDAGCTVTGCQNPTPICNTTSGDCEACGGNPECVALGTGQPLCDNGSCVECTDSLSHCAGDEPICNATTHRCEGCDNSTECLSLGDGRPVCNSGPCVQCTTSATHCTQPGHAVCDPGSHTCQPCEVHADCNHFGGVCDQGICVAESEITYVDRGAFCPGIGTRTQPFCEIDTAIATTDPTLILLVATGNYRPIAVQNQILWLVGAGPNVVIDGSLGAWSDGVTVEHQSISDQADLTLENLSVLGTTGVNAAAVSCTGSYGTPVVQLIDVDLPAGDTYGLQVTDCDVSMVGGLITGHSKTPLQAQRTTLQLDRVRVIDNTGGGISLNESPFTIENTIVARNGSGSATIPGIGVLDPTGTVVLRHVTVADNDVNNSVPYNSGLACLGGTCTSVVIRSCLFADNDDGDLDTTFSAHYSLIKDGFGVSNGTNNIQSDPAFVSGTDAHILGTSPCRGAGDPASPVTHDFDGDARPNPAGSAPDCGADEVP